MSARDPKLYRPGVGLMLLNKAGRVFAGKRIDMKEDAWQMPQGGIDEGEDPRKAAMRELREEIGTDNAEIVGESRDWYYYDLPVELRKKLWGGRYLGQRQKWYALRFLGLDSEIDLAGHSHPEFSEWKWVVLTELPALIVPFKRPLYNELAKEFVYLAQ